MNKKTLIGIIGIPTLDDEGHSVIALYNDYKNAIIKYDCLPFMICPILNIDYYNTKSSDIPQLTDKEKQTYRDMVDTCSGIIIPGGYRSYNFDEYIVKYAIDKDIPVLGTCRGLQLLANIDNSAYSLEENNTPIEHKKPGIKYVHDIKILKDSLLYRIVKSDKIKVNSNHHYHATKVNKFKITAYSSDNLIEAIELPNKSFVMGVQWHPERMVEFDNHQHTLFKAFIDACKKR